MAIDRERLKDLVSPLLYNDNDADLQCGDSFYLPNTALKISKYSGETKTFKRLGLLPEQTKMSILKRDYANTFASQKNSLFGADQT